jgi:hypothetical protein
MKVIEEKELYFKSIENENIVIKQQMGGYKKNLNDL